MSDQVQNPLVGEAAPITPHDVLQAAHRIRGITRRTPLERSAPLSTAAGMDVWLKLETLQRTGSFKLRGATNAIALLSPEERARGLVTASAGNHGLGVALAARELGARATVFVPAGAPATKRQRIAALGATLHEVGGGYDEAHAEAEVYALEHGALYLHAFSDPGVVAGQGTVALEIFDALPEVRTLLVPVGGGGLVGGVGTVARAVGGVRVVGVQSTATAAMHASLMAGRLVSLPLEPTLCDGLAGDVDEPSLSLARRVVDEMVLVPEDAVRQAMRRLYREEGVTVEGSGAVAAAALWEGMLADLEPPVVAVLSGANVDAALLAELVSD